MTSYSISEAARRLHTSPRMLRYRESLGLLTADRSAGGSHRRYSGSDLSAANAAIALERRYDISPGTLAFALRLVTDPRVLADVRDLAARCGRNPHPSLAALDFDQQKALRLLATGRRGGDAGPAQGAERPVRAARSGALSGGTGP
ncbi:MAG: MerR family transcriptional regulator [Actinomycetota bacterium]|nr:MerR family transcriptional regulator [Actinomycetota bacterium]